MYRLVVKNLSKKFSIGCKKKDSTLARVISILSNKESKKKFQVLKNISFNVKEGEMLGIIGNNGSGKSTLLRTIAGIYKADKGTVEINGRVISVINLNAGLNMRLTMKDNIFLCSSLYGLSKKQTQHIFNKIILFAELEKYIDTKLYQFSSGMLARLSFSIAIFCTISSKANILILDEVFNGVDKDFKSKSKSKLLEIKKKGITILISTHNIYFVKKNSDRVIWIKNGKIKKEGQPDKIVTEYLQEKN